MKTIFLGDTVRDLVPYFIKVKDTHPGCPEGASVHWSRFWADLVDLKTVKLEAYDLGYSFEGSYNSYSLDNHIYTVTDLPRDLVRDLVRPHFRAAAREEYEKRVKAEIEAIAKGMMKEFFK